MNERIELTPTETVTIRSSGSRGLEVEVEYGAGGSRPPKHFHPQQDEQFEVLEGALSLVLDGVEHELSAGDEIEIPRGAVHQMWNPGETVTRALWTTTPPGRTENWFRDLGALRASGRVGADDMPGPLAFAVLLTEYSDVFRLAGPQPLLRGAFAALAPLGRARGYSAMHAAASR
jgi:mannose-6-phosphate isomerase-like protein (cupin superfamily)